VQLALKLVYVADRDEKEDREFFEDFDLTTDELLKAPNEVRIAVARARGLLAMDSAVPFSSVGKSSDPYVVVKIAGTELKAQKTKTLYKTLAPVWNASMNFGVSADGSQSVELAVFDHDLIGSDDFLGLVVIPLKALLEAKHKAVRAWHPLGERAQRAGGDGSRGQLLVVAQWRYNRDLDFAPFHLKDDVAIKAPPNELRIALFRGRDLAIKDKNLMSKGGTSDPRVSFEILGGQKDGDTTLAKAQAKLMKWQSTTRSKTLEPVWREVYSVELRLPAVDDLAATKAWTPPVLRCVCEDVDGMSGADFMGLVEVALEALTVKRPRVRSEWFPLMPDPNGKLSSNVHGELQLSLQWRYNADLDYDPWAAEVDAFPEKPPNELRVALVKGRNLSIKDKPLLFGAGSSDPRCTFKLVSTSAATDVGVKPWMSKTREKSLNPCWCEQWSFPLDSSKFEKPPILDIVCEDVDSLSAADFMGKVDFELADFLDKKRKRAWHPLVSEIDNSSNVTGDLNLIVMWAYNPVYDFDPWAEEVEEAKFKDKEANELCVAVIQGRNLAVKDKALLWGLGSSDPRLRLSVVGTKDLKATSKTCKKTLAPCWRQTFELPFRASDYREGDAPVEFGQHGPLLSVVVEDVDEVTSSDFMGRLDIPLLPFGKDKKRGRAWHSLQADSGAESSNVDGEVELVVYWRYNESLDFEPFLEESPFPDKAPNELRIGLAQARNLAVKDKNLLSKGGSSDPRATFSISGTESKCASTTKFKALNPRWSEVFTLPFDRGPEDSQPPLLQVLIEDVDEVTAADFMGLFQIELATLTSRQRSWHSLVARASNDGESSSNVAGEVDLVVQLWYNPALDFSPFEELLDPKYSEKRPNELRIAIVQGRGLAVKDKNLLSKGGTSDPFVRLSIEGGGEAPPCQTDVKRKTLTPVWNAIFQMPLKRDSKAKPRLRLVVEDYDDVSAADFMGMCSIELNLLLEDGFSGLPTRKWHALKTEEGQSANVTGDLEVWLQWWYSPALDFDPFVGDAADDGVEEPNELRVAIVQAKGLAIKDKNLFSKGGSSDPRATVSVPGTDFKGVSTVKYKTLEPRWCEIFQLPFSAGPEAPKLEVVLEDVDEVTSADFMGRVLIELEPLRKDRSVHRQWHTLEANEKSSNISGEVELVFQWRFNPALSFSPFDGGSVAPAGKKPNELCVALVQGRDLAVKDKNLVSKGGSSDPVVRFVAGDLKFESTVLKKSLNPVWKEVFVQPFSGDEETLQVIVEDWDEVTQRDFMGSVVVKLCDFLDVSKPRGIWFPLVTKDGEKTTNVTGAVELIVCWRYNAALDFSPFQDGDGTFGKKRNALRIGLGRGRGLAVKDKNLVSEGGSSDPRMKFEILPATSAEAVVLKSTVKHKTLEPSWRETFSLECAEGAPGAARSALKLRCVCEDVDSVSGADFMGSFEVPLAELDGQSVSTQWYDLAANSELDKTTNVSGSIELVLQWWYDATLDYDPFPEPDEYPNEERNELRVAVCRGRNLAIKDKNLLTKGGSSDPRVTLSIQGKGSLKRKTKTISQTLDPVWKELFTLPLSAARPDGSPTPKLVVLCEDVDAVSSADFMGRRVLDIQELFNGKKTPVKLWLTLLADIGGSQNVSGEIEVVVDWRHNPSRAFTPFENDVACDSEPNELRIGLFQAAGLKIMDHNLLSKGGSSDPRVAFSVRHTSFKAVSTAQKLTLEPIWKEIFILDVPRGPMEMVLDCVCEDVDALSAADLMGKCEVDLSTLADKKIKRLWLPLGEEAGALELVLHWRYNPLKDFDPFQGAVDDHPNELPNELRIALVRGLGLAIRDQNLLSKGGSSDPRMRFLATGLPELKSHTISKCLDPIWHEQFVMPFSPQGEASLKCVCEDVDSLSGADAMGDFTIDLAPFGKSRKAARKWYALETGHVQVALQWWFNPVESFDPFAEEVSKEKPPNELRIGLFRGRGLPVADKNLVSSGGSSDPRMTFSVGGVAKASSVQKHTLDPVWKETFDFALPRGPSEMAMPILSVLCEDYDSFSSADQMGSIQISLEALFETRKVHKKWHSFDEGEVELVLQWRFNPDLDYDPFQRFHHEADTHKGKEPTELRIALFQARGLAIKDKNVLSKGGSSDPRVRFELTGQPGFHSRAVQKTLQPVWREQFAKALSPMDNLKLRCFVEDADMTGYESMGEFEVDIATLADHKVVRKWYLLKSTQGQQVSGYVELILQWGHEPALCFDPFVDDSKFAGQEPNQLRIGLFRARSLEIADKNLVSQGGSSDPFFKLSVATWSAKSTHKSKTLEPVYKEIFDVELSRGPDWLAAPVLRIECLDYDAVSQADAMGFVDVPLEALLDGKVSKKWYSLSTTGDVELVLQWRFDPNLDYAPFRQEDDSLKEEPNELRVAIVRALDLPAKDANLLSKPSSDARCTVALSSSRISRKTKTITSLDPVFQEQFIWACSPATDGKHPTLAIKVEDVDALKNDSIGSVDVDLGSLLKARWTRQWYKLSEGGCIEVISQWKHNPALKYAPFAVDDSTKQPNLLRIGLSQGRELKICDSHVFTSGGTSDPYCKLAVLGTAFKFKSAVKAKTTDPVWRQEFECPVAKVQGKPLPLLSVECYDHDSLSASDTMGALTVDLEALEAHSISRKWYDLEGSQGEIELVLQHFYSRDHDPFASDQEYDPFHANDANKFAHLEPNEMRVALVRGKGLAVKKDLLVKFDFDGQPFESKPSRTLVWKEHWALPMLQPGRKLQCVLEGDKTPVGDCVVDLTKIEDQRVRTAWYPLAQGSLQLIVQLRHNPARLVDKSNAEKAAVSADRKEAKGSRANADEEKRRKKAEVDALREANEAADRAKRLSEDAAKRKAAAAAEEARRKAAEAERLRLAEEERKRRQAEADRLRAEDAAKRFRAAGKARKAADVALRLTDAAKTMTEDELQKKRQASLDAEALALDARRRAARRRRLDAADDAARRLEEEDARRRRLAGLRDAGAEAQRQADAERRAAEAQRFADEAKRRADRHSASRLRRSDDEALRRSADDDRRFAATQREADAAKRRAAMLARSTAQRLEREAEERLNRERDLRSALADDSRNWAPSRTTQVFPLAPRGARGAV